MSITDRLTKANNLLLSLDKKKIAIEQRIEKALEEICKVEDRINRAESEMEKVVEQKVSIDMRDKLWGDISLLKKEKKDAEKHLDSYRKQLQDKFKKMKKLAHQLI